MCSNVDLEFEIVSFSNPNSKLKSGKCCFGNEGSRGRCPLTCRTFFTACAYGGATGGTCQTKHYTHLQSGIMGNSTFGSNGAHLDQSDHVNKFVIRGKTRKSLQVGFSEKTSINYSAIVKIYSLIFFVFRLVVLNFRLIVVLKVQLKMLFTLKWSNKIRRY